MDEYVGLEPSHTQSYNYFMNKYLFNNININKSNINIPSWVSKNIDSECKNYEKN